MAGAIWRDVTNFLGDEEVTPLGYLPIIEMMAARHAGDGHFLQYLPKQLTDPKDRTDLDRDLRYAHIGHHIVANRREALLRWANGAAKGAPYEEDVVIDWWRNIEKGRESLDLDKHALRHGQELIAVLQLAPEDSAFIAADVETLELKDYYLPITWLRQHHQWAIDLAILRDLAYKTWPADNADRRLWAAGELGIVEEYYSEQAPELAYDGDPDKGVDPFAVRPVNQEQSLGMGMGELSYCMYVIVRSAYIGFMDEILEHAAFPRVRGSLRCVECGMFVVRRALGYGQLYCGDTCKKRAAKRRYRAGHRVQPSRHACTITQA